MKYVCFSCHDFQKELITSAKMKHFAQNLDITDILEKVSTEVVPMLVNSTIKFRLTKKVLGFHELVSVG